MSKFVEFGVNVFIDLEEVEEIEVQTVQNVSVLDVDTTNRVIFFYRSGRTTTINVGRGIDEIRKELNLLTNFEANGKPDPELEDSGGICENHIPVQHRDWREPWCNRCGLTANFEVPRRKGE